MDALREVEVLRAAALLQLRPAGDSQLTGEVGHERLEVGSLLVVKGLEVLRDVVGDLLDENVLALLTELRNLLLHLAVIAENFLTGHLVIDRLDEGVEGDGRLGADVTKSHRVEEWMVGILDDAGLAEGTAESFPGTAARGNLAGLNLLGGIKPFLVARDEIGNVIVNTPATCPGDPVLDGRLEIDRPETVEERRIHLIDGVGCGMVNGSVDAGLGVKLPTIELTVENDLEGCLHNLRRGSVELIEKEAEGLRTGVLVPVRRIKSGHLTVSGGKTNHVTLGHLREATVEDGKTEVLRNLSNNLALTDAVWPADENGGLNWKHLGDGEEGLDGHIRHDSETPVVFVSLLHQYKMWGENIAKLSKQKVIRDSLAVQ